MTSSELITGLVKEEEFAEVPEDLVLMANDVYKIYQTGEIETVALRGVSFQIFQGEIVAVVGPSGSGKTTLVNLLGGTLRPSAGQVYWSNIKQDISKLDDATITAARRGFIGFVFQVNNLLHHMTARQNVELSARIAGFSKSWRRDRSKELLEAVGLGNRMDHVPGKLSGGERQRVAIASALMNNPQLVLADEPTGDLDLINAEEILDLFKDLNNDFGTAFLIVTHSQLIASKARRTLELRDGIISGTHDAGVHLKSLETTRILELDNQDRLPLPENILRELGHPRRFQIEVNEGRILLTPSAVEDAVAVQVRLVTCRICGKLVASNRVTCPNCGTAL
ncbi:MAG: ABC transporter ATP-binding protein [Candidatus Hermodarchaeota archaeon]|nr:ABC transporter ATP-binding protein [Candidatus Hermodarchaeota archaeon]